MNEKQSRLLVWLAAILVGLVALVTFIEKPKEPAAEGEKEWRRLFPEVEGSAVQKLEISRGGVQATFEREGAEWKMTAPKATAADTRKVDALVDTAVKLEVADDLGADRKADFGLSPALSVIKMTLTDGRSLDLQIGGDAPVGWQGYVASGDGPVLVCRSRLSDTFDKDPTDLRTKAIIRQPKGELSAVRMAGEGQDIRLSRDDHGWWVEATTTQPATVGEASPATPLTIARSRADEDRLDRALSALDDMRVERFPDGPVLIDPVQRSIELESDQEKLSLVAGLEVEGLRLLQGPLQEGPVYARTTVLDSNFRFEPTAWLGTALLPVRAATLETLVVQLGDKRLEAKRGENGWDQKDAEGVLRALQEVRVDRRRAAASPIGEPWGTVSLVERGRTELIQIHQAEADGGRVIVDAAGGAPMVLPPTELQRIQDALDGKAPPEPPPSEPGMGMGADGMPDLEMLQRQIEAASGGGR
jgi:hypothetical protein